MLRGACYAPHARTPWAACYVLRVLCPAQGRCGPGIGTPMAKCARTGGGRAYRRGSPVPTGAAGQSSFEPSPRPLPPAEWLLPPIALFCSTYYGCTCYVVRSMCYMPTPYVLRLTCSFPAPSCGRGRHYQKGFPVPTGGRGGNLRSSQAPRPLPPGGKLLPPLSGRASLFL